MQNLMVMVTCLVLDRKYPFWVNLVHKIKIISFSWNLIAKPIRICRIQWCCSLFPFSTGNNLFGQIWSKKKINLEWNLVPRLIRICGIQWWCSLFSQFLTGNNLFGQIRPKKIKIVNLSWKFVDSLIQICRIQWCCSIFSFSKEIPFLRKFGPENENYQFKMKFVI